MEQDGLLEALQASYQRLLEGVGASPGRQASAGAWGAHEIVGHIAAWAEDFVVCLEEGIHSHGYEDDHFNAGALAALRTMTYAQVREACSASSTRLVQALAARRPWPPLVERRVEAAIHHVAEHMGELRAM